MASIRFTLIAKAVAVLLAVWLVAHFVGDFRGRMFLNEAAALAESREWSGAEAAAGAAVRQDSSLGLAWYYKGAAEAGQGRIDEGAADLRRAIQTMGNPTVAQLTLGEILANQGKWSEARPLLEAALEVNPKPRMTPGKYWQLLAECRRKKGDAAGAIPALWMAAIVSEFAPGAALPLAESYRALGHNVPVFPDSLALYFAEAYPPDAALKRWVIVHYEQQGRKDLAAAFLARLIERGKGDARDHLALALYYNQLGAPRKALDVLAKVAPEMSTEPLFFKAAGEASERLGDLAGMRRAYQRYLELNPAAPDRAAIEAKVR